MIFLNPDPATSDPVTAKYASIECKAYLACSI